MNSLYYSNEQIDMQMLHKKIMDAVSIQYYNYTKPQKVAYKIGQTFKSFKNFMSTPQASALGLISFWAAFVISYFFLTLAINSFTAYIVFGLIFLIHTHLTFDAVDALVKEAIARNIFGSLNV
jgi:hypothetical protein